MQCRENYDEGAVIIKQGDKGDFFYVVEAGEFDVLKGGKKFSTLGNKFFGEIALLYNSPRAATIKVSCTPKDDRPNSRCPILQVTKKAVLWALDRQTFRRVLAKSSEKQKQLAMTALGKVDMFKDLTDGQRQQLASVAQTVVFEKGDIIIKKGEAGELFYIVQEGKARCTNVGAGTTEMADSILTDGSVFGERALLYNEPRAATVIAESDTLKCLVIDQQMFTVIH
jgi:CRP-like cAMP-binding protein